jgi:PKD repeat protein
VAGFTASCTNLSCSFTDGSTDADGRVVAWRWSFGDGGTASTQNPSHTYAAAGTYTVQLTVTDDQGATGTTSKSVTVTAPPPPNQPPVANPGGPYRSEGTVSFDGSGSSDPDNNTPLTYAWDFGDGTRGTGVRPTHTYRADGTYTVTLTVTDAKGARSAPAQTTATIGNIPPTVNAGPDVSMLPGFYSLRATFSDPGATDAPWTYTISWGDGSSETGRTSRQSDPITATHLYLLPGQYRVRVTVTDKDGGSGSDELIVTVGLSIP